MDATKDTKQKLAKGKSLLGKKYPIKSLAFFGSYASSGLKTIQRKWNIFLSGEKENPSLALATVVFYFEA